ncbi:hypothetical protein [Kiloniella sp. b19]|uniref:hypothetical protein n=1 Tax=Kiloniella sp. GXU_MW_B19 TaxID=3141326 RepID=UPI0031E035E7
MLKLIVEKLNSTQDRNLIAMLSLNLLLLAFFIMLTTLADFEEEKAEAVLASVNQTFDGQSSLPNPQARYEESLEKIGESAALIDEIGSLFQETIPVTEVEEDSAQNFLRLTLPVGRVFLERSEELLPVQDLLVARLLKGVSRFEKNGGASEIELLYGVGLNQTLKGRGNLVTRRLDSALALFEREGYPARQLSIGLQQGYADRFLIVIRLYSEDQGAVTFEEQLP